MPKAVQFDRYGGVDVLQVRDVDRPTTPPGRVLVRVLAGSVRRRAIPAAGSLSVGGREGDGVRLPGGDESLGLRSIAMRGRCRARGSGTSA
jgi:hypothetical protein